MQGSKKWTPPGGVLGELVAAAQTRAQALRPSAGDLRAGVSSAPPAPSFLDALSGDTVAVIAEVKRASPSKGAINEALDVGEQCRAYEAGGAAAISVLTEPARFAGKVADLVAARTACALPLLRKDFIVDELQILEARASGASAVLLIARAMDPSQLKELFRCAVESRLYALVEVRDGAELETAVSIGATIIGVNNRNLETLEMDDAAQHVLPLIPRKCIAVAESGYRTRDDVMRAASIGADAVLIGSELSVSLTPASLLEELASVKRTRNARAN
ncbi:MAG: indole-3-glycerol-phosphate synthase [Gemmatimonadaceae bacterium]|nr:indole-3-glycerol-phosphate synthase [Gemmatimonadaceae bacterium]